MRTPRRGLRASTPHTGQGRGGRRFFLAPVVDGWTLAVLGGGELFEDDVAGAGTVELPSLSRRFGEVQKFATHRVVEYQAWQRWVNGLAGPPLLLDRRVRRDTEFSAETVLLEVAAARCVECRWPVVACPL